MLIDVFMLISTSLKKRINGLKDGEDSSGCDQHTLMWDQQAVSAAFPSMSSRMLPVHKYTHNFDTCAGTEEETDGMLPFPQLLDNLHPLQGVSLISSARVCPHLRTHGAHMLEALGPGLF